MNADDIALGSAQCAVEFFCRNTQTAEKSRLGPAVTLDVAGTQRSYTAVLPSVTLLPGSYRVACVARLHNAIAPVACMQGPLLQVEALG